MVVLRADYCRCIRPEAEDARSPAPLSNHWLSSLTIGLHPGSSLVSRQHIADKSEECWCWAGIDRSGCASLLLFSSSISSAVVALDVRQALACRIFATN